MDRMKSLTPILVVVLLAGSSPAVDWSAGLARADIGSAPYAFTCNQQALTADFASRDELPQTQLPPARWYTTDADGHYPNRGWGPAADALPPPAIPTDAGCAPSTWKQERILAVAMRYIYSPDNPLGLQYRHHHIPGWNPPNSTYAGVPGDNPDTADPADVTAWGPGAGLDCSNFTAWVYNYGLGIKFNGNVHDQFDGTAGPMGAHLPPEGPFEPGDLLYLHPTGNADEASHVVIFIDDQHIIDSRVDAQNLVGVHVRHREGWYRDAVLAAWRPIS